MSRLSLHPSCADDLYSVDYEIRTYNDKLSCHFEIASHQNSWNVNKDFRSPSNWGLWDYDVFELFLDDPAGEGYWEFQVSPLGQRFQLKVLRPRELFYTPLDLSWKSEVMLEENKWRGELLFQADFSKEVVGNVHACLGKGERCYYGAFFNNEKKLDFHRPELFRELL